MIWSRIQWFWRVIKWFHVTMNYNSIFFLDENPPEVWKTRQFDDILLRHCNAVYNQNPIDRWMKGCILPFHKKGDLGLAKNYRGITLTSIAANIYNALQRKRIEPKIDNILRTHRTLLENLGRAHKWCTPMDPHIWPSKRRTNS